MYGKYVSQFDYHLKKIKLRDQITINFQVISNTTLLIFKCCIYLSLLVNI